MRQTTFREDFARRDMDKFTENYLAYEEIMKPIRRSFKVRRRKNA